MRKGPGINFPTLTQSIVVVIVTPATRTLTLPHLNWSLKRVTSGGWTGLATKVYIFVAQKLRINIFINEGREVKEEGSPASTRKNVFWRYNNTESEIGRFNTTYFTLHTI